jgi:conjugative transfer region protein TrbK
MNTHNLKRLPALAAVALVVLVVAACAVRLRGDESQTRPTTSTDQASDQLATKLTECRSATYEQKDVLADCRKAWAEKRRQFLGQKTSSAPDNRASQEGPSLFVPKDESRLSPNNKSNLQEKE